MHAGAIDNPKSAAGRVYKILLEDRGCWFSGWDLTVEARVTAIGTRVSEVRHQLPAGQRIEHRTTFGEQRGSWYRLVVESAPLVFSTDEVPKERMRLLAGRETGQLGTVAPQTRLDFQRSTT